MKCLFCQNRLTCQVDIVVVRYSATNNGLSCKNQFIFQGAIGSIVYANVSAVSFALIVELLTKNLHAL